MRLLDLALDCYGPFGGLRLHFDPQARMHIVYGANEAGKSCALKALGDLFYGAPRRSEVGFLRPRELRIGATLRGRNGQILQFSRRRGDKNTLCDAAGGVLPDDALAPFLGVATRDIFERAFGLDAAKLRQGGDDMLRADGEIGASLFAASSGLRSLVDLRKKFENEAGEIFSERKANHRSFYQALQRFDSAREQERAAILSDSTLKNLKGEIAAAEKKIAEIENGHKIAQAEKQRLGRLLKAAPIMRNLARLRAEHGGFDDLAVLPADGAEKLARILARRENGAETAARAAQAREAARQDFEESDVDETLLAQAERIEKLIGLSGGYVDRAADLPRRETALREARQVLLRRAQECGLPDVEKLRVAAPDAATLKSAERLCVKGRQLESLFQEPRRALAEEEALYARMRAKRPAAPELDADGLREKSLAIGPVLSWDANWREAAMAVSEETRGLAEKCARLAPPLTDLDLFARSPSPDAASIEQAARIFDEMEARERTAREKAQETRTSRTAAEKELARLERQGAVATLDALRQARASRDAEWFDTRAILLKERPAPAPEAPFWNEKTRRFETLVSEADRCADALLSDAARVAAADAAREKIATAEHEMAETERALAQLAQERARREADWARVWKDSGILPLTPRQMISWRSRADNLLETRESLARQKARARDWETRLAEARPHLEILSDQSGLAPLKNLDSAALARRIETRLAEIAKAQDAEREARAKIADAPIRIAQWKERLAELAEAQNEWRADWRAALAALRLDEDASFDEAQKRLALWWALPGEWEEERERFSRATKIAAGMREFEQNLDALLALCARDLPSRPVEAAVAQLRDRLSRAREKSALRRKAHERFALAEAAAKKADEDLAQAHEVLLSFRAEAAKAGLDGEPEILLRRLGDRQKLSEAIKAERDRLFLVADGFDEVALADEAENFDADAARIKLDEIERLLNAEEERAREIFAGLRGAENEWTRLQTTLGAEAAIQAKENARAEILQESRRWAVLKLASLLVDAALERSRDRRKDPLLARAGALFSILTIGRYSGLDQAFGDDDSLQLRARRAEGEALDLAALSEGARDQLFLALRLAFLEDYAQRSEAPPFIGDDLFASFDDERVAAGLRTLGEASALLQPVLFTHHAHIVEIARSTLGESAQILRLE